MYDQHATARRLKAESLDIRVARADAEARGHEAAADIFRDSDQRMLAGEHASLARHKAAELRAQAEAARAETASLRRHG
ncbi:hypothetical protein OG818_40595 [Streptomyces virginiae]|uniref:hypothetical protein n=1 Tax=Streptomyces virginiae TaxID=1961 RepID=UPI00224FB7D8|nr:hypothetical protein [Streptomyces virginiae]MCX4721993.1 hypothetical protein [Streptomyces virginiae]